MQISGDLEKVIRAYLIKGYIKKKLESLVQGCLTNPPSLTSDSLAMQLAGTAGGSTCWEWVSSYVHTHISHAAEMQLEEK